MRYIERLQDGKWFIWVYMYFLPHAALNFLLARVKFCEKPSIFLSFVFFFIYLLWSAILSLHHYWFLTAIFLSHSVCVFSFTYIHYILVKAFFNILVPIFVDF